MKSMCKHWGLHISTNINCLEVVLGSFWAVWRELLLSLEPKLRSWRFPRYWWFNKRYHSGYQLICLISQPLLIASKHDWYLSKGIFKGFREPLRPWDFCLTGTIIFSSVFTGTETFIWQLPSIVICYKISPPQWHVYTCCNSKCTSHSHILPSSSSAQEIPSNNFLDTFLTNDLIAILSQTSFSHISCQQKILAMSVEILRVWCTLSSADPPQSFEPPLSYSWTEGKSFLSVV